jgi:hypothetical protein
MNHTLRKHLSFSGLTKVIGDAFEKLTLKESKENGIGAASLAGKISLSDCLMSGFAMFSLKYESLLRFDNDGRGGLDPVLQNNLKTIFGIKKIPSDTTMRERLDKVDPQLLNVVIKKVFAQVQRGKGLEGMESYQGDYCISLDGTGVFGSTEIKCESCMVKNEGKDNESYYHQSFCAVLVKPGCKTVLPIGIEAIVKTDGMTKNDCELNAAKRLIPRLRTEHPKLPMCLVLDGLHSKAPIIELCSQQNMKYIIVAKNADHKHLFWQFEDDSVGLSQEVKETDGDTQRTYRFKNGIELNASNPSLLVNVLEVVERTKNKPMTKFVWVTSYKLSRDNASKIAAMGRSRWKIENETFNTLKNLGYNYDHNFGHGNKNLSSVFCVLMYLAFSVDQILERCCQVFKAVRATAVTKQALWRKIRVLIEYVVVSCMEDLHQLIIKRSRLEASDTT